MRTVEPEVHIAVDLCCGSGAVTAGLLKHGFSVIAAVDNDPTACSTYRANHPDVKLLQENIQNIDPRTILDATLQRHAIDLLVFCAPCQPFSSQNRKRGIDKRAKLLLEAGRFARVLRPKCIFFENVPGLTSPTNQGVVKALARRLKKEGYILSVPRRLDAAETGVPQRRARCVMVAARSRRAVEIFQSAVIQADRRTVRDAIGTLPPLRSGEAHPHDYLHRARAHKEIALRRLRAIPVDGGSRKDLPVELRLKCHTNSHSFSDVYGRMSWDDVAPTLTTGCDDVTRGRFAHPDQDRAITLREAALLQTFPSDYMFSGSRSDIARQIGNAVPMAMVEALGL